MALEPSIHSVIQDVVQRLIAEYQPRTIILFGSYAAGQPDADSDIDLLIIKDTSARWLDRLAAVRRATEGAHRHIAFDPLVLTPQEIEQRLQVGDQFIAEIIEKGVVLLHAGAVPTDGRWHDDGGRCAHLVGRRASLDRASATGALSLKSIPVDRVALGRPEPRDERRPTRPAGHPVQSPRRGAARRPNGQRSAQPGGTRGAMYPEPVVLDQLVQRIVEAVHPLRIVLFGSAARGEMGPESDIDVLVVMPEGVHRRRTAQDLQVHLHGVPVSIDIVVATPADLDRHQNTAGLIYRDILREGKEIYAA